MKLFVCCVQISNLRCAARSVCKHVRYATRYSGDGTLLTLSISVEESKPCLSACKKTVLFRFETIVCVENKDMFIVLLLSVIYVSEGI